MMVVVLASMLLLLIILFMVGEQTEEQPVQIQMEQLLLQYKQIKLVDSVLLLMLAMEVIERLAMDFGCEVVDIGHYDRYATVPRYGGVKT